MINVNSKITINTDKIKQLEKAATMALKESAELLHNEIVQAQVIPRDKGTLQGEAFFVDTSEINQGKASLVHATPYGRRWYYNPESVTVSGYTTKKGKKVESYTAHKAKFNNSNPNAKDHWFDDWLPGGAKANFFKDTFKRFFRRFGGV